MKTKREYSYSTEELSVPLSEEEYYYENIWKDQITEISGESITYDEIGNPVYYRDKMIFEWEGKMLSKADSTTGDASYTYNNEGVRTSKTINGVKTEYIIEGRDIVFETGADGTTAYIYDSDMNVIGMMRDNAAYYYEKNAQGDVIRILDENADILCEYTYDAWGRTVSVTGDSELAEKNPFRYRSYYFDNETGLYYVESRYYDPETGRFINADNIEGIVWDYTNLNMYAYCGNDPVNYYDPTGEAPIYVKYLVSRDMYNAEEQMSLQCRATNMLWVSDMKKGGSSVTYIIDNKQDFIDSWNSLISTTVVVIDMHGSPYYMWCNTEKIYADEIVSKLTLKNIKFVWLLSCNTGHQNYRNDNIATAIADKITGVVIASDGTVSSTQTTYGGKEVYGALSKADSSWKKYAGSRITAKYWMLCSLKRSTGYPVWYDWGREVVSIYDISYYLQVKGFISYK